MSKLLIKEPPLQVLPSLAVTIGLNEAIIVQQLHYWLENKSVGVERDGFKWVFNTYDEWKENFPFWSVQTIQRTFLSLEKMGVIVSAQLDAKKHDQKKFYRIDYVALDMMDSINLIPSDISKCDDVKGITETTANTINKSIEAQKQERPAQKTTDPIIAALYSSGIIPNAKTLDFLTLWRGADEDGERIHTDERVIQAIQAHPGKAQEYIDRVLISWQANGYPKTREELLLDAKNSAAQKRVRVPIQDRLSSQQEKMRAWLEKEGVPVG